MRAITLMLRQELLFLIVGMSLPLVECGGGSIPSPTVTGIFIKPSDPTAYSQAAPPQNQVSFSAYIDYNDGTLSPNPISNLKWTYDFAAWIPLTGNVATCTQPAPLSDPIFQAPVPSEITATALVGGKSYTCKHAQVAAQCCRLLLHRSQISR